MARVYATVAELSAFTGRPAPDNAERLLARASRLVDREMKSAVYEVDTAGMPTVPEVRAGFREAVCAQVDAWAKREAEAAETGPWDTVSAGPISFGRSSRPTPVEDDVHLTAEAVEILEALSLPRTVYS